MGSAVRLLHQDRKQWHQPVASLKMAAHQGLFWVSFLVLHIYEICKIPYVKSRTTLHEFYGSGSSWIRISITLVGPDPNPNIIYGSGSSSFKSDPILRFYSIIINLNLVSKQC